MVPYWSLFYRYVQKPTDCKEGWKKRFISGYFCKILIPIILFGLPTQQPGKTWNSTIMRSNNFVLIQKEAWICLSAKDVRTSIRILFYQSSYMFSFVFHFIRISYFMPSVTVSYCLCLLSVYLSLWLCCKIKLELFDFGVKVQHEVSSTCVCAAARGMCSSSMWKVKQKGLVMLFGREKKM